MRKDPEKYRARKQKQQQEMMALYQQEGANPAASCLPLLAQAPIFLALFWTLRDEKELLGAPFYFITEATAGGLEKLVSTAGWPGWLLIVLMSGTMFFSQKQMMARNAASMVDNPMAQQQKILLYVMPIFLAVVSFQFPLGILLYWVTTNFWQIAQQAIILRESSKVEVASGAKGGPATSGGNGKASPSATSGGSRGATSGRKPTAPASEDAPEPDEKSEASGTEKSSSTHPEGGGTGSGTTGDRPDGATSDPSTGPRRRLPRRGDRR
jgi:YidC/Oxa1 family membrane protein insertase